MIASPADDPQSTSSAPSLAAVAKSLDLVQSLPGGSLATLPVGRQQRHLSLDCLTEGARASEHQLAALRRAENVLETAAKLLFLAVRWAHTIPSFIQVRRSLIPTRVYSEADPGEG